MFLPYFKKLTSFLSFLKFCMNRIKIQGGGFDVYKESGARIKELRLKKGVTQEQMANDLGVTVETISRIERGVRGASIDLISLLSGYFNITIDFLVDGKVVEECNNLLQGLDTTKREKVLTIMRCVIENI